jgi:hypothetical protein
MITRRTLLIFQLGNCLAFVLVGLLSTYTITTLLPSVGKAVILQTLDVPARKSLSEEEDIEHMRGRALYYFDLAAELKQAHGNEELGILETVRYVCYVMAALFGVGGLLCFAARTGPAEPGKSDPQVPIQHERH